jgi:arsenate reductase
MNVTIYHNPDCGTSRKTLQMIRDSGIEPEVIEYLTSPPSRDTLMNLLARAGLTVRDILREKETIYADLGLQDQSLSEARLLDAIEKHPILMNRPIVSTPLGVRLCRPAEELIAILPTARKST